MKTKIEVLKTKAGKVVATVYPWDDQRNRDWQRRKAQERTGEKLKWVDGGFVETMLA